MKMASVRFGSLWDFLIGKEKTRSTNLIMLYQVLYQVLINHRFAADVRLASVRTATSLNSLRLN